MSNPPKRRKAMGDLGQVDVFNALHVGSVSMAGLAELMTKLNVTDRTVAHTRRILYDVNSSRLFVVAGCKTMVGVWVHSVHPDVGPCKHATRRHNT